MKSDVVTSHEVFNQALGDANTITPLVLPAGTYHLYLRARASNGDPAILRIHQYSTSTSQATTFFTVPAGEVLHIDRLQQGNAHDAAGKRTRVLHVSSPTGNGVIAEALCWQ